jgi:EAL domain-containing protein (putative c-di-GMP-specific phosphodiesterase class I)
VLNGERPCIDVWDTGVGIAPERRNAIFAEYYQIDKSGRDRSKARWLKSVGWLSPSSRQASVKRRIRDRRDAELKIAVFGGATGARIATDLSVFLMSPQTSERDAKACWIQWTEDQLRSQPQRQIVEQAGSSTDVTAILAHRCIRTFLQPIVRVSDRAVVGFEALSRGPKGSALERPDKLFDAAYAAGRTVDAELLCAELALEHTKDKLPPGAFLTINLGPDALALAVDKLALAGRREVMVELTEHLPLNEAEGLVDVVRRLRTLGIRLALDDTGCGFADFDTVRLLRPDIVKLCITVIRNADKGSHFTAAIRESAERLCKLGCQVLAEGVEREHQHAALRGCGIELAQGWLYSKPEAIESVLR